MKSILCYFATIDGNESGEKIAHGEILNGDIFALHKVFMFFPAPVYLCNAYLSDVGIEDVRRISFTMLLRMRKSASVFPESPVYFYTYLRWQRSSLDLFVYARL